MTTMFTKGQAAMVCHSPSWSPDEWCIGIVTRPTDPEYLWTGADVCASNGCTSSLIPGYEPKNIRLASPEDLDSLPDWARSWIDEQLLDSRNPKVPYLNRKVYSALHVAGIHRLEDLQQVTEAELLALKGVGKKAVADLRTWQQKREEVTA